MRSFCCGATRAQTSVAARRRASPASSSAAIAAPLSTASGPPASSPAWRAIARAVSGWSPVIITTRRPAPRQAATAAGMSGRSGSASAARPSSSRPKAAGSTGMARSPAAAHPRATASTRRPAAAIRAAASSSAAPAGAGAPHIPTIASGAPLAATSRRPSPPSQTCTSAGRCGVRPYSCTSVQPGASAPPSGSASAARRQNAASIGSLPSARLARRAQASSSWCGAAIASPAGPSWRLPSRHNCATAIRFSVRVPVLSTHSTEVEPRISIAARRRVSTWLRASRQAPMAGNTVRMTGNSSGNMDIDKAMPASSACNGSWPRSTSSRTSAALTAPPRIAKRRASALVSRCRRPGGGAMPPSAAPMRPISLRTPVALTRARPCPCTTSVPEYTHGRSAPPGACGRSPPCGAGSLPTGTDSPVSSDSSTCRPAAASSRPSAGTRSPSPSSTRSPSTSSPAGSCRALPSRHTRAVGAPSSRSACRARSVRPSWYSVMHSIRTTIPNRKAPSKGSPSTRYRTAAPTSSRYIGSRAASSAMRRQRRPPLSGSRLGPSRARRRAASSLSSPAGAAAPVSIFMGYPVRRPAWSRAPARRGRGRSTWPGTAPRRHRPADPRRRHAGGPGRQPRC